MYIDTLTINDWVARSSKLTNTDMRCDEALKTYHRHAVAGESRIVVEGSRRHTGSVAVAAAAAGSHHTDWVAVAAERNPIAAADTAVAVEGNLPSCPSQQVGRRHMVHHQNHHQDLVEGQTSERS